MAKYLHRKCRECLKWSVFPAGDAASRCGFCGGLYGKLTLGLDVQDAKTGDPEITGRDARSIPATELPDVQPGDFEYVDPTREAE